MASDQDNLELVKIFFILYIHFSCGRISSWNGSCNQWSHPLVKSCFVFTFIKYQELIKRLGKSCQWDSAKLFTGDPVNASMCVCVCVCVCVCACWLVICVFTVGFGAWAQLNTWTIKKDLTNKRKKEREKERKQETNKRLISNRKKERKKNAQRKEERNLCTRQERM